jgi:hypothetical protein
MTGQHQPVQILTSVMLLRARAQALPGVLERTARHVTAYVVPTTWALPLLPPPYYDVLANPAKLASLEAVHSSEERHKGKFKPR